MQLMRDVERGVKTYGEMIRVAREMRGITSTGLSLAIGRNPGYVSRIEVGSSKETPPPDVMEGLSRELGLPIAAQLESLGYRVREGESQDVEKRYLHGGNRIVGSHRGLLTGPLVRGGGATNTALRILPHAALRVFAHQPGDRIVVRRVRPRPSVRGPGRPLPPDGPQITDLHALVGQDFVRHRSCFT